MSVWLRNFVIQSCSVTVPCDRHSASDKLFCCVPNKSLYWHGTLRLFFPISLEEVLSFIFSHLAWGGTVLLFSVWSIEQPTRHWVFSGMKTNSIYSVEVKYLYIVKARSKWCVQVIEEISSRTGNWHGKVRFSSSILTIAPLFLFLETFR